MKTRSGYTLLEMLVAAGMLAVILGFSVQYFPSVATYFRRLQVRQQIQGDAAAAMDTMTRLLRVGMASSVAICSCNQARCGETGPPACNAATSDAPPNSQFFFRTQDGHLRRFYWASDRTLRMTDDPDGDAGTIPPGETVLARNVGSVMFTVDAEDFSLVTVNLFMSALDGSGIPEKAMTLAVPSQTVRMVTTN